MVIALIQNIYKPRGNKSFKFSYLKKQIIQIALTGV